MARRLIVDSGVLIAQERRLSSLTNHVEPDDDIVISDITVAELRAGVHLASDDQRKARARFVDSVLAAIPVQPYDDAVADAHGMLLAHVHRSGRARGAHDLIIAATAVSTRRILLTSDRNARFDELPGVDAVIV